ncbi:hypothetical protein [Nitratireductor basaltis]|uniref:Uncharacterized protein n=1 Tax=Nitratireductor basaltis TaxID=472175 RepID=A0A084UDI0_9HYPH|nr:hypothetical protein [Nitratireductor basaltis]KFB11016.1 hypothetical protein EL18_02058 [Nitratireductor basaltis]
MTDPFNEEAARLAALDLFPGREWEDLTDGERDEARKEVEEFRRLMGDHSAKSPTDLH